MFLFKHFFTATLMIIAIDVQAGKLRELLMQHSQSRSSLQLPHVKVLHDVAYGQNARQTYDVYLPESQLEGAPVILIVHGGGWRYGDKDSDNVVENKVNRWVNKGFIFISINYPMLPEADVQAQEAALMQSVIHAQQTVKHWGGDPTKFILMGHSAGAHLVALLNADPQVALSQGAQPWLGAVALDSAVLDVPARMQVKHMPLYDQAFGKDPVYWQALSPIHHVTALSPPLLTVCSTQRADHPCDQARAYQKAAQASGRQVTVLPQDKSHGEINATLGADETYTIAVEQFMAGLDPKVSNILKATH